MSYLDKCSEQTDLFFNKLKPSRNIIVFIVSENCYVAYTLNDIKEIMGCEKNHYIEGLEKLETFFYLPNGIRVDSSLSNCFENKVNTMKLIESKNKFYIGIDTNKQIYSYYSVEAVLRQAINSDEDSTFDFELNNKSNLQLNTESDIEIDMKQLQIQRDERKAREIIQSEKTEDVDSDSDFNSADYDSDFNSADSDSNSDDSDFSIEISEENKDNTEGWTQNGHYYYYEIDDLSDHLVCKELYRDYDCIEQKWYKDGVECDRPPGFG